MNLAPQVWRDAMRRLQKEIPDFAFATWIRPVAVKVAADRVVLGCPSSFHRDRIRIEYRAAIERHLRDALGEPSREDEDENPSSALWTIQPVTMKDFLEASGRVLPMPSESIEEDEERSATPRFEASACGPRRATPEEATRVGSIRTVSAPSIDPPEHGPIHRRSAGHRNRNALGSRQ